MYSFGGAMKLQKLIIFILAFSLAGCANHVVVQEIAGPQIETTLPFIPSEESTLPTELFTTPIEATEPTENENILPQMLVQPEPSDDDFVLVRTYIPDVFVDLCYSTNHNFTNQRIYEFADVWLRYGTVKKLILVQEELKQNGLYLKIWDGFRPPSAQFKLWNVCPDPTYVSDPNVGFSSHSRGNTVDITLVHSDGTDLVMPTGFDDFSKLADRDYRDCSPEAAENALLLEGLMIKHGFRPYSGEWWHFTDTQSYPVDNEFEPIEAVTYAAYCNEYISLRAKPSTASEVITKILAGEQFEVVAYYGDFALIEYNDLFGFVLLGYIRVLE